MRWWYAARMDKEKNTWTFRLGATGREAADLASRLGFKDLTAYVTAALTEQNARAAAAAELPVVEDGDIDSSSGQTTINGRVLPPGAYRVKGSIRTIRVRPPGDAP